MPKNCLCPIFLLSPVIQALGVKSTTGVRSISIHIKPKDRGTEVGICHETQLSAWIIECKITKQSK